MSVVLLIVTLLGAAKVAGVVVGAVGPFSKLIFRKSQVALKLGLELLVVEITPTASA